jgi:hypothetical protein
MGLRLSTTLPSMLLMMTNALLLVVSCFSLLKKKWVDRYKIEAYNRTGIGEHVCDSIE